MEIYLATLFLILIFCFCEVSFKLSHLTKKFLLSFIFILIVFQIGLRWETGTDWEIYLDHFYSVNDISTVLINTIFGFEIGYGLLTYYFHLLFGSYTFFLILHACFFYYAIFKTSIKYSPYVFVSILFFYSSTLGLVGSNRQLIALSICLLALPLVEKKKAFYFFSAILFASLFHTSALIFGFFYFFNRDVYMPIFISIFVFAYIIGKTSVPLYFFSLTDSLGGGATLKVAVYTQNAYDSLKEANLSSWGAVKRFLFLVLFSYNLKTISQKLPYYKIIYNGYAFGLLLYLLFSSSLVILINRGSIYFNIMESLLLSSQLVVLRSRTKKTLVLILYLILSLVIMFQSISAYSDLFDPYKGLFYNADFSREMY